MSTVIRCCVVVVMMVAVLMGRAGTCAAEAGRISVLQKDGSELINPVPTPPYVGELGEIGLVVDISGGKTHRRLDWEQIKQYNLLVMTNFARVHGRKAYDPGRLGRLLGRYLREGGGILYIGQRQMASHREHDNFNEWLRQYGAELEWATVNDPEHRFDDPPDVPYQSDEIIRTSNFADHPITEGVDTLYLRNRVFYSPYLRPLKVSEAWTVLMRAMPTARVVDLTRPKGGGVAREIEDSARQEAAPLMAIRQVGKGRLAVFGHNPGPFWYDLGRPALGRVCAANGDGERGSDWMPLLRNLAEWLSVPARKAGFPGGSTEQADFRIRPDWGTRNPIHWDQPGIAWTDTEMKHFFAVHSPLWSIDDWRNMAAGRYQAHRILIGARTRLTGGKGSVQEWKTAARQAGYDGIVFREDLFEMTEEEWNAFEEECREATDDSFVALPGQQFVEWEGNRFMRFNWSIPWHNRERLNEAGDAVRSQLHFFFDAGHGPDVGLPANFPLWIGRNETPWWSYRVYDAVPVAVYDEGRRIEDNTEVWERLVGRIEHTGPLSIHLLEDPAEIEETSGDYHNYVIAKNLHDLRTADKWRRRAVGIGQPNNASWFVSNGPIIDAFLPLGMYRTTLGIPGIEGTYRHRIYVRAHSDVPIQRVEIWSGDRCLRRYRPDSRKVWRVMEDLHDGQDGVYLRVVDAKGRTAMTTSPNVHDKKLYLQWCGDHCNMLGGGLGVTPEGEPAGFGVGTHVKMRFKPASGPGAGMGEASSYIPYGTDTASPTLKIWGEFRLLTPDGSVPTGHQELLPDLHQWHGSRNLRVARLDARHRVDRRRYLAEDAPKPYNSGYISAWGAYVRPEPLEKIEVVHDDMDFHRNAGQPAFQLVRGTVRFKDDVTLSEKRLLNLRLGRSGWHKVEEGWRTREGLIKPGDSIRQALGRGNYFTFSNALGHGTIFALDDHLAVSGGAQKERNSFFRYGYSLGGRSFEEGDTLTYRYLIMRWPVGMGLEARLDRKVAAMLGLSPDADGVELRARRGGVLDAAFGFKVAAEDHAFLGELGQGEISARLPLRITGLNGNWAGALWREGQRYIAPLTPDPDGVAWALVNPSEQSGPFFLGNVLTCDRDEIMLRLFEGAGGGWEVLVHNPLDEPVTTTVRGSAGGPVAGMEKKVTLAPGEEMRWEVNPNEE